MKVELIACSRPLSGQCGINKSLSVAACMFSNPMRILYVLQSHAHY